MGLAVVSCGLMVGGSQLGLQRNGLYPWMRMGYPPMQSWSACIGINS